MLWSDMVLAIDFLKFIWYWFFFYQQIMMLEDENNIYPIFYFFAHFKNFVLKDLVELPINTTFDLKFLCSTGDEWNLVYNEKL